MKKKIRTIVGCILYLTIVLFIVSCVDGYKDNEVFSPGVTDTQLESPDPKGIKFLSSSDGSTVTIEWPVVYGAGGYEFSLYIIDDPQNPILVGEENEFVDGCTTTRDLLEDTKYKAVIKTLGNKEYNNTEALKASEAEHSTLVKVYATIPSGTELGAYFDANPVPPLGKGETEIAYQLEPGGSYTMTSDVSLDTTTMTIRGDKINHAKIKMSTGSFISDGAGLKFKFIDFDCSDFANDAVLTFNGTLNPNKVSNGWVTIRPPVAFQSCNVTGLNKKLIWDNNKKYGLQTMLIKDCVVEMDISTNMHMIYMQGGFVKDTQITTSTFYNKQANAGYWIQYNNNRVNANSEWKSAPYNWLNAGISVTNCTFYQIVKTGQICNYAGLVQKGNYITLTNNIFVDCSNKLVVRYFTNNNGNMDSPRVFGNNTYFYGGVFIEDEITGSSRDNSGTAIKEDPKFKDPANGDFTVGGSAQKEKRTGDPRWLPAQ